MARGHPDDRPLVQAEHELEVVRQVGEQGDLGGAGVGEQPGHPELAQHLERCIAHGRHVLLLSTGGRSRGAPNTAIVRRRRGRWQTLSHPAEEPAQRGSFLSLGESSPDRPEPSPLTSPMSRSSRRNHVNDHGYAGRGDSRRRAGRRTGAIREGRRPRRHPGARHRDAVRRTVGGHRPRRTSAPTSSRSSTPGSRTRRARTARARTASACGGRSSAATRGRSRSTCRIRRASRSSSSWCARRDVVIENFRPGTLERWGLGYDRLRSVNPRIILTRVTGFGQTGPRATEPAFGTIAEAMSGFAHSTGQPDGPPTLPPLALADNISGLAAAVATLTAPAPSRTHRRGAGHRPGDHRADPRDARCAGDRLRPARHRHPAARQPVGEQRAAQHLPHRGRRLGRDLDERTLDRRTGHGSRRATGPRAGAVVPRRIPTGPARRRARRGGGLVDRAATDVRGRRGVRPGARRRSPSSTTCPRWSPTSSTRRSAPSPPCRTRTSGRYGCPTCSSGCRSRPARSDTPGAATVPTPTGSSPSSVSTTSASLGCAARAWSECWPRSPPGCTCRVVGCPSCCPRPPGRPTASSSTSRTPCTRRPVPACGLGCRPLWLPWAARRARPSASAVRSRSSCGSTRWAPTDFAADLAAVGPLLADGRVHGIRLPKVESPTDVSRAYAASRRFLDQPHLVPLIESALGLRHAAEIAAETGVHSITLGESDLRADLGLPRDGDATTVCCSPGSPSSRPHERPAFPPPSRASTPT